MIFLDVDMISLDIILLCGIDEETLERARERESEEACEQTTA